jgi:hypothetical protein
MTMKRMTAVTLAAAIVAAATFGMASAPEAPAPNKAAPTSQVPMTHLEVDLAGMSSLSGESTYGEAIELSKNCKCPNGCAMRKWMKKVMQPAMFSGDMKKIGKALHYIGSRPVAGYSHWKDISSAGAKAAEKGDMKGVKKSCNDCHKVYRKKYRKDKAQRCRDW